MPLTDLNSWISLCYLTAAPILQLIIPGMVFQRTSMRLILL